MRVSIDTNILAYAEGVGDVARRDAAVDLLTRLPPEDVLLPVQVLGELFRVLTGKAKCTPDIPSCIQDDINQTSEVFKNSEVSPYVNAILICKGELRQPVEKAPDPFIFLRSAEKFLRCPLGRKIPRLHKDDTVCQFTGKTHVMEIRGTSMISFDNQYCVPRNPNPIDSIVPH